LVSIIKVGLVRKNSERINRDPTFFGVTVFLRLDRVGCVGWWDVA
jgi:hypothetical protein